MMPAHVLAVFRIPLYSKLSLLIRDAIESGTIRVNLIDLISQESKLTSAKPLDKAQLSYKQSSG